MNKLYLLKYTLLPITSILYFGITYLCLSYVFVAQFYVTYIGWIWLILFYGLIISIVGFLNTISTWLSFGILYLYKYSWISVIIHSLFGLAGLVFSIIYYFEDNKLFEMYSKMWYIFPIKTILLTPGFVALYIGILYTMIFSPIIIRFDSNMTDSKDEPKLNFESEFVSDTVESIDESCIFKYLDKTEDGQYNTIVIPNNNEKSFMCKFELEELECMGFRLRNKIY